MGKAGIDLVLGKMGLRFLRIKERRSCRSPLFLALIPSF